VVVDEGGVAWALRDGDGVCGKFRLDEGIGYQLCNSPQNSLKWQRFIEYLTSDQSEYIYGEAEVGSQLWVAAMDTATLIAGW
jgi:hypothetical protein